MEREATEQNHWQTAGAKRMKMAKQPRERGEGELDVQLLSRASPFASLVCGKGEDFGKSEAFRAN